MAAELLLAIGYSERARSGSDMRQRIVVKIVSNFSRIRMMNGGCAYRKIAFD
jgi:hypothetical protein